MAAILAAADGASGTAAEQAGSLAGSQAEHSARSGCLVLIGRIGGIERSHSNRPCFSVAKLFAAKYIDIYI